MNAEITGTDGTVGMVGTGIASRYRLHARAGFLKAQLVGVRPLHRVNTNY